MARYNMRMSFLPYEILKIKFYLLKFNWIFFVDVFFLRKSRSNKFNKYLITLFFTQTIFAQSHCTISFNKSKQLFYIFPPLSLAFYIKFNVLINTFSSLLCDRTLYKKAWIRLFGLIKSSTIYLMLLLILIFFISSQNGFISKEVRTK